MYLAYLETLIDPVNMDEEQENEANLCKMVRYETTAAALNFTTYLLACNPDVQVVIFQCLRGPDERTIFLSLVFLN